ncbi:sialate O-acetylesterase [Mangrovibacterium sp.]|uniref:sialate O-acetylesterase n=1 Tax=Mangrovibacterium sp. TaxID=1961364 RepID=UPI0035663ED8
MRREFFFISIFVFLMAAMAPLGAGASVKLPRLVSNGMVLQRDVPVKIWGWADPSEKVKVDFLGKSYQTKADKKGNWELELPALTAGGPYKMQVNSIEISDILVGDVWLASGQSNMELQLRRVMDLYADEIKQIDNTNIRLFRSSTRKEPEHAQPDYPDGNWLTATPENIMEFSAVAYFFADDVYQQYHVPVGIISTAIGGSPAESWLSKDKVAGYLDQWKANEARIDSIRAKRQAEEGEQVPFNWGLEVNKNDPGAGRWSKADVDVSDWPQISLPGYWSDKGVELRNGSIWFYKEFEVADSLAAREAVLRLGRIIDSDSAFVNGTFVGTISYQYPPRIYKVPEGVLKPGKNKLMVRVFSQGGRGGFVEEKPYEVRVGSQTIDLTGDWNYHIGAVLNPPQGLGGGGFVPGGLFNSLISPAVGYGLKGVIWYQGESNAGRGKEYRQLFKDMITDWRTQMAQPELPFVFVQLANLGIPNKQPVESGWATLRDAQRRTLELPNTGMAVAFDLGEWNDIHPLKKKEVARRLFLEARRVAYGDSSVVSSGPLYESMKVEDGSIVLRFNSVGSGLFANSLLQGFQIAGDDGVFVWANAVVLSRNTVKVWSRTVSDPKVVRYAWDDNPAGANLKNKRGLPASPFTTEE